MAQTIKHILFGGGDSAPAERRAHLVWVFAVLTAFGLANGFLALRLAACSYAPLWHPLVYASYFAHPPLVPLNVLPGVLLAWLGYFLTRRAWAGYLTSAVPVIGLSLVNYYKIQLRGDPFVAADLLLARTAGGIVGHYHPDLSRVVLTALGGAALMLLCSVLLLRDGLRGARLRFLGFSACLLAIPVLYTYVYMDNDIYYSTVNTDAIQNEWSDVEVFISRGFWYPFVRSVSKAMPTVPEGYNPKEARAALDNYPDADIPPDRRVNVMGVMLEAFSDLTDFPMLAELPEAAALYAPLHELESRGVHGDLLTNIFAGGTVDSEWGFLTGYSIHNSFRAPVDSFVRYFASQGYDTQYRHPGYSWFYNRRNINEYLGFADSVYSENGFGERVDPETAPKRSDRVLFDYLLHDLDSRTAEDAPLFSFSVSYQNHGPYADDLKDYRREVVPPETGWTEQSRNVLNNYFDGIGDTISELLRFTEELDRRDAPVVLVLFGDHKPWLGNDASVYLELGVDLDQTTLSGFYNYYSTPYLIWANRAAKELLGSDFTGVGRDVSPCLLMSEVFDRCGWEGPAFLGLQREMRGYTGLMSERGWFMEDGQLTQVLGPDAALLHRYYRWAEYWRESRGLT